MPAQNLKYVSTQLKLILSWLEKAVCVRSSLATCLDRRLSDPTFFEIFFKILEIQKLILTLLFEQCHGHHHIEGEAKANTKDQVLEKFDSVEEFKTFYKILKEPAQYIKFVSTFTNVKWRVTCF